METTMGDSGQRTTRKIPENHPPIPPRQSNDIGSGLFGIGRAWWWILSTMSSSFRRSRSAFAGACEDPGIVSRHFELATERPLSESFGGAVPNVLTPA